MKTCFTFAVFSLALMQGIAAAPYTGKTVVLWQQNSEWEKFMTDNEAKIRANAEAIADFNTRVQQSGNEIKLRYERKVAELEQRNNNLKQALENYKDESPEKWEKFRQEFNKEMASVETAIAHFNIEGK